MKKQERKNRGITLIALIITIIILLILAGVTIAQLTESGLFNKAKLAKQKSENAQIKEEVTLGEYENTINQYIGGTRNPLPTTVLYPNGGTSETPSTISVNQRIEIDNPYPGHRLYLVAEVKMNDVWCETGFIYAFSGGFGVKATQLTGNGIDKIIVQSGTNAVSAASYDAGNGFGSYMINGIQTAPFRVIAICLD